MKITYLLAFICFLGFSSLGWGTYDYSNNLTDPYQTTTSVTQDTIPLEDRYDSFIESSGGNPFDLNDPATIQQDVEYDPATNSYLITERIGSEYYRAPTSMTFDEYMEYREKKERQEHFQRLSGLSTGTSSGLVDPIGQVDVKKDLIDRLFGGNEVSIKPQGNIDLTLGADFSRTANPSLPLRTQRQGGFDFDMAIQMNVDGSIGEKLKLSTNYNTQATFGFDNQMKLNYDTDAFSEDEIIKKIEAGDVSLPLKGTLIQGAQRLFGLKTEVQFGRLRVTGVASQNKSRRQNLQIEGGAQKQDFEVRADQYDENRHFFLSHFNRENFEPALENLPQVQSLFLVKNIEIWVTNTRNETEDIVDIIALADMGEQERMTSLPPTDPPRNPNYQGKGLPGFIDLADSVLLRKNFSNDLLFDIKNREDIRDIDNTVNILQSEFNLQAGIDFKKVSARKLRPNEYTLNAELGTISLNVNLQPDDVLGVAYEYSYNGENFQVGEMSQDVYNPEELGVLFVKMLKSSQTRVDKPIWDLMMKNVYSLGAFQVSNEDFFFDIYYEDPGQGFKRFLPETNLVGVPLLRVFNLDGLNIQGDPCPDGIFDFVPGITINPKNGRVMFPVLEPFGANLVEDMEPQFREKYEYFHLYDSTLTRAREYPDLNRFAIRGSYKSSISSEISLNSFNLPEGSVTVSAGGVQLIEGLDYEVDYNIGKVRILNDAYLNSGTPVNVNFEDNSLFTFQQKTLLGLRADYEVNKNLVIGGTYMHLFERPFTQKVNIGDDPISNRMMGLDVNYSGEAPWLTKMVDAIPFIQTKEPSTVTFAAEAAFLKPGHARAINLNNELDENGDPITNDKGGTLNIDDFEGSATGFDLRNPTNRWVLASVPQNDQENNNPLFPESQFIDSLVTGMNRAKLSWYRIDDAVRNGEDRMDPYTSLIPIQEIFPNRANSQIQGRTNQIPSLDLHYKPFEKGPYNYDVPQGTDFSAGLESTGQLAEPQTRWAGIMRALPTNDFEASNIEYIEFWMLNPFIDDGTNPGDMYINLGNVSEDILKDSRRFFENGLPTDQNDVRTDFTSWGQVPRVQSFTNAFSQDPEERMQQDLGLDGLDDAGEQAQFQGVIDDYLNSNLSPDAIQDFINDPSNDNFIFFRDPDEYGPLGDPDTRARERYSQNNNPQGNSEASTDNQIASATNIPDAEDLNRDNSLNEDEQYFQYHIPLEPVTFSDGRSGLDVENNPLITDFVEQDGTGSDRRTWYRFRIPIENYDQKVGGIQDFRSIQFIRMYLTNFQREVTLRFGTLELTRNQWRRYRRPVDVEKVSAFPGFGNSKLDLNAVSIEENSRRQPFNYVLPPGVQRESVVVGSSAGGALPQNEQSLAMIVDDLPIDSALGIYKILNLDMRVFEEMELFIHAEARMPDQSLDDEDLALFIRLGSDFENNFYEYEIPLTLSDSTLAANDPDNVWPLENRLLLNLKQFIELKKQRNLEGFSLADFYEQEDTESEFPGRKYRIKGNPNLGLVKGVMIGVVNRDIAEFQNHSAEVWVNELRVHGLDESGAAAALARVDFKLADFGSLSFASNYASNGWGGIEQKLAQRSREEVFQYDAATNLELGKFFGEDSGIKIPMYASLNKTIRTPQFDPYDLDIPLREKIQAADSQEARDSIRSQAQDVTSIKSLNFTNVRKTKTNKKAPMPWDISNFSATYAYVETERNNPIIESDKEKKYRGAIDYSYQLKPLYIEPFKKLIKKDKYLKFLKEANLNLIPNSFSFSTNVDREFQETKYRFTDLAEEFSTFYNKRFTWDRNYNLNWDIMKGLKFNFSAVNRAIVDELKQFDNDGELVPQDEIKAKLWNSIQNFGRTKDYSHNVGLNYTLPFKQLPFLDFITVKTSYTATYNWAGAPIGVNGEKGIADTLGNVIQNSNVFQINGDLNFETLYKKSKYLTKIDRAKNAGRGNTRDRGSTREGADDDSKDSGEKKKRGSRKKKGKSESKGRDGGLDTPDETPEVLAEDGKDRPGSRRNRNGEPDAKNGTNSRRGDNKDDKKAEAAKKKQKGNRQPTIAEKVLIRPLLTLRKARINFTENRATVVPGFLPSPTNFGLGNNFTAPGWDFVAGVQPDFAADDPDNWRHRAVDKMDPEEIWISDNLFQNQRVSQTYSQTWDAKISLEPFNDFKIELSANKRYDENELFLFKDFHDDGSANGEFHQRDLQTIGSFQISYLAVNTLFGTDSEDLVNVFKNNRIILSNAFGSGQHENPIEEDEYALGYGRAQEDVVVPAFLAAYSGNDVTDYIPEADENGKIDYDFSKPLFSTLPNVNWNLTYNGLNKIGNLSDIFQSVKLTHGYRSSLNVNSYNNDQAFNEKQKNAVDDNFNFYSRFQVPNMVINEQFSPLLGLAVKTKGGVDFNLDFKKSRNLSLSYANLALSEQRTDEYVVGFGYTMENVYIAMFYGKKGKRKKTRNSRKPNLGEEQNQKEKKAGTSKGSDLNFKFDFSYRDDLTVNYYLDINPPEPDDPPGEDPSVASEATRGTRSLTISPSIDYDVSERLNIRIFYDHRSTTPKTSLGYKTSNTSAGVTVRFSLN